MTPRPNPLLHRLLIGALILIPILMAVWLIPRTMVSGPHGRQSPIGDGSRIVALSPALAITLKDLGLAGRIVGRHGFDLALDKSIPVCGDQSSLDYEALIRVHPTHVLTEWGAREIPPRLRELAAQNHWKLQDYAQLKLDDVLDTVARLGLEFVPSGGAAAHHADSATNAPGDAVRSAYTDLMRRMRSAWLEQHPPLNAGRVLLLESIDPPAALGPGSFHHQILERIGGTPAITTGKAYITLDAEDILRLAPDGIILLAPRTGPVPPTTAAAAVVGAPAPDVRARLGRIGTLDIPAVRRGHLALIDDPFCLTPSTALLGVSEQMERILKGWASQP